MASKPPVGRRLRIRSGTLATVAMIALLTAGCLRKGPEEVTGSIGPVAQNEAHRAAAAWAERYQANPGDITAAMNYAHVLRASDQRPQAVAVLQQAVIRAPNNLDLLAAYGKALADVGRYKEAAEVLGKAHVPERPNWRILSAQGAVADQVGDHALAQRYYEAALKIVPGEPTVLSNLGLSYALSRKLPEAEKVLRQANSGKTADGRVRQNLALVLGLQGRFGEAEEVLRQDLSPAEAAANVSVMRGLVRQPNSWKAIKRADEKKLPRSTAVHAAAAKPPGE
jgi:Flp pilus assembly protein TadD